MNQRASVPISTLKPGTAFHYDTPEAMAAGPLHRVLATEPNGNVRIRLFCDAAMTGWASPETLVFPQEAR